ncbi:flavin-containing monooxygenase [Luteimonas aquatica]|uniref:flavin-containing monooxygenase n=1 Tax=Luteimonas aquatica TaxID=450364 RepID=UPI001F568BAF|nr:NAD(P)/FAD-dependent oxidoreductase [Luteimonas aquatica]
MSGPPLEHFDVLVVGAGLSGIGAGYRLQTDCPGKRYAILEARADLGGTWDLFRYPGVRSDSDMFTLGFPFRPWKDAKSIADGASILRYLKDTAREFGIDRHIRFGHRVRSAAYASDEARWRLEVDLADGGRRRLSCDFLYLCSGYYDYAQGYTPQFPGREAYRGQWVHPQQWPQDLDYTGKRVLVIGSGATAVTLVPALAERAAHVTMLQRSPTYIADLPSKDVVADAFRAVLPERLAHRMARWKNVLLTMAFFQFCRRAPGLARKLLRLGVKKMLPEGYDVDAHFAPRYAPWDQRLCLIPDSDLFKAIGSGKASVETDHIDTFTADGVRLRSGKALAADVVVSATGLQLQLLGGLQVTVDGKAVHSGEEYVYKGLMVSHVPNFAFCVGYTNASWTLRADLASTYVCRLLNYMDRHGYRQCVARCDPADMQPQPLLNLNSGYITRAAAILPRQGSQAPWRMPQNYLLDLKVMRFGAIEDPNLQFSRAGADTALAVGGAAA